MIYVTVKQNAKFKQMSLDNFLFGSFSEPQPLTDGMIGATRTYTAERVSEKLAACINVEQLVYRLTEFNRINEELHKADRHSLYHSFKIPKRHGGWRKIDAPNDDLMLALRNLKDIFEKYFKALYHTSAFAYIKNRSTIDAVRKHQRNESKWFAKLDLSNFFGSTTKEYVISMFSMIFPFSEVLKDEDGRREFSKAIDLAFLDGVLPQGTPISPLITNVMMIPVDHALFNTLRDFNNQTYVYTRYADDFIISSRYDFNVHDIEKLVVDTLKSFNAPFSINAEKTRYGSSSGRNWNLGVMLNKDNKITVGHENKKRLKCALFNFIMDYRAGNGWCTEDIQHTLGVYSYYRMVERETIDAMVDSINKKHNVNVIDLLKSEV